MVTTLDGVVCKRGTFVYEVGVGHPNGTYMPCNARVHMGSHHPTNPDKCCSTRELCQKECDKLNNGEAELFHSIG